MEILKDLIPRFNVKEILLGVSLGTGYMTSLRFLGPIGVSELLMLVFIFILLFSNRKNLLFFPKSEYGIVKLIMLSTVIVVFPIITVIFYLFGNVGSQPVYVLSFIAGCLLTFQLAENINNTIDMKNVTLWFAVVFLLTNFLFSQSNPETLEAVRYTGAAKNPNQLVFYATSLTLLLIIYSRLGALIAIPPILYFMLKVGSDAYIFSLFLTVVFFFILYLIFKIKANRKIKALFFSTLLFVVPVVLIIFYTDLILSVWLEADEGNARTTLMFNGLVASLKSPLFGYGAGSFSSFEDQHNVEAHNTFLDLSMQFGFMFPVIIYYIFIRYFIYKFNQHKALDCAFFIPFLISGLFHFSGRHFIFWVELGVFMSFIYFPVIGNKKYMKSRLLIN